MLLHFIDESVDFEVFLQGAVVLPVKHIDARSVAADAEQLTLAQVVFGHAFGLVEKVEGIGVVELFGLVDAQVSECPEHEPGMGEAIGQMQGGKEKSVGVAVVAPDGGFSGLAHELFHPRRVGRSGEEQVDLTREKKKEEKAPHGMEI